MSYNPFSLEEKTVLVTGASSGIGRAIAIECAKLGAKLIISGRNQNRLQQTFAQLSGKNHRFILADLSKQTEIDHLIDTLPNLDGVVHCAGFTKSLPIQFINANDLSAIMQVNFVSPTLITQTLYKNKKLNKGASIVFISSISGVYCSAISGGIYSASKGAINGIAKTMAIEMATRSIRVNTVCPGMIQTSIFDEGVISEDQLKEDTKKYPLKRYGKPEEVAYAVIYLLSDASQWVTGSNLLIDGGYTLL
ncbi:SDR family NAD(P)-dependent oxidoreductase [Microbacter margulisiae]|uniref:NAD(P)-dependent dehydrogenase (Short-subunit alcohol dehydrogenase family) n=1 Tax=Microbacter margulisiae TaxID=1350067 RepID=A0A7W5H138_9PORP|nr:SDR family oxidoreductase [Microbacter margulisiae]MBB3185972.1 NAD(P)-dependent dehydrogenase (short-subunit alcohol dehydrogenase family) [Microbacter margulisiae]